jgi:NADPH-dependent glutamate synthase beta subunit-like oxidoreductase
LKDLSEQFALRPCRHKEELLPLLRALAVGQIPLAEGKSVGIVGSGPAGLAAAHDLALFGFKVTIYEVEPVLGGMLAVGIPHYRLPRDLIRAEVETIVELGVEPVTNCCVGRDVSLPELRQRHDAVVIAVGAKRSRKPGYPDSDAEGVLGGVEFFRDVALGTRPPLGQRVVVVGGGDAAMDAARTALRVPTAEDDRAGEQGEHYLAMDAARLASRVGGREIHIVYRRSRAEMPAVQTEIEEADEEGIHFHLLTNPVRIEKNDRGQVCGLWCEKMELGQPDASGRREPVPVKGSEFFMECDSVLLAIGQTFDLSFVDPQRDGLRLTKDGRIECDPKSGTTAAADVFVAGDLAHGAKLLIHAVASGKAVARSIYERLTGNRITAEATELHFPLPTYDREPNYEKRRRLRPGTLPLDARFVRMDMPVELGFTPEQACREAGRCFDCGVNTIFNGERCVLCGGCVDVCPERCLRIVSLDQMAPRDDLQRTVGAQLDGFPAEAASAIIKDETICIRCGLCADRCPTGAITMERLSFEERPRCLTAGT